ncbi:MAG: aminoglycoside phosphotransferase family protein [Candidatus Saccharibacteria bacterium]
MLLGKELINNGLESKVYKVNSVKGPIIIKTKKINGRVNYLFEAYAYNQLIKLGAKVPKVIDVNVRSITLSLLDGEELDDKIYLFNNSSIFKEIADDLKLCKKVNFKGYGPAVKMENVFVGRYSNWQDYLDSMYNDLIVLSSKNKQLTKDEYNILISYWQRNSKNITPTKGNLVHGDFSMGSIFVNENKYAGIIDFGDAFIGDPIMDLAYFRFKEINKEYGDSLYRLLINQYLNDSKNDTVEFNNKILLYMIFWAVKRISHCPNKIIRNKFVEKTKILAKYISDSYM